jgi:2-polyprenyl-3-methyl-5-hydroxy-6-metoxy-1,4-benzoquinol methylase
VWAGDTTFSAGVIGTLYAWAFENAGHSVSLLVRPGHEEHWTNGMSLQLLDAILAVARRNAHGVTTDGGIAVQQQDATPGDGRYYGDTRHSFPELISVLGAGRPPAGRALDVGCSYGYLGEQLLALGYGEVWGIEPVEAAAREASTRLSQVICSTFPADRAAAGAPYELIVFADTLEHMVDPWDALRHARDLLSDTGQLLVSVPNVSHYSVLLQQLRGRWVYADQGLLDKTHLRFFTPLTIREAVNGAGFVCVAERSSLRKPKGLLARAATILGRRAGHLFVYQQVLLARAKR